MSRPKSEACLDHSVNRRTKLAKRVAGEDEAERKEEIMEVFNRLPVRADIEISLPTDLETLLHNQLIEEMESYLMIVFDEATPIKHIQQQAYLNGRIDLLKQLLNKEI